jgi:replicative DNA helicase
MANERQPPHSLEAERATLGSVLIKPSALDDISDLPVDDFFLPAHREILEAMRAVAGRGRPLDVLAISDELKARGMLSRLEGGATYLNDLANATPTAENVAHYARTVRERATRRRLIASCSEIVSMAYGDGVDTEELLADARQKLAGLESPEEGGPSLVRDELDAVMDSIEHRNERPDDYFVPTGLRAFDEKVIGLRGGNLVVVAARPGRGKSAWAVDILLHAASKGIPVLLFSFEMSKGEIVERMFAKWGRVDGMKILSGRMQGPEWERVHEAGSRLARLPFWLDTRNLTAARICSAARRWLAKQRGAQPNGVDQRLALIAIDYMGLVKSTGDEKSREREVAVMSSAFKQLAAELNVPVVAISQINRESEKAGREPRISDLRESGAIEQDANMILFPHWEDAAMENRRLSGAVDAKIIVAKNRGGATGFVWAEWVPEFVTFRDADDHQPQQGDLLP